jgi:hypothetical protein
MAREKRARSRYLFRAGLFALALPLLNCSSWGPPACNIPTCNYGTFTAKLQSGSVEWLRDAVPLYAAGVVTDSPGVGDCKLMPSGKLGNPTNPAELRGVATLNLHLAFQPANAGQSSVDGGIPSELAEWGAQLAIPTDPRSWSVGEASSAPAVINEQYSKLLPDALDGGPTCCTNCNGTAAVANLHIVVEQAVGGPADTPLLVTPDYVRVFRIEYDGIAGLCGDGVTSHVSLQLTQTAVDFANQQTPCYGACI